MTKENGEPTAAEKGKGKMVDKDIPDGKKSDEAAKDKDGKPLVNGKKGEEPQEGQYRLPERRRKPFDADMIQMSSVRKTSS